MGRSGGRAAVEEASTVEKAEVGRERVAAEKVIVEDTDESDPVEDREEDEDKVMFKVIGRKLFYHFILDVCSVLQLIIRSDIRQDPLQASSFSFPSHAQPSQLSISFYRT
jgi:hypothetical protein